MNQRFLFFYGPRPKYSQPKIETIECGEEKPRQVISGLVRHIPLEEMQNRMVVLLCNLKPAKMRGIVSEAMVMCASTPDKVGFSGEFRQGYLFVFLGRDFGTTRRSRSW